MTLWKDSNPPSQHLSKQEVFVELEKHSSEKIIHSQNSIHKPVWPSRLEPWCTHKRTVRKMQKLVEGGQETQWSEAETPQDCRDRLWNCEERYRCGHLLHASPSVSGGSTAYPSHLSGLLVSEASMTWLFESFGRDADMSQNNSIISNPLSNGTKRIPLHPTCGTAKNLIAFTQPSVRRPFQESRRSEGTSYEVTSPGAELVFPCHEDLPSRHSSSDHSTFRK